jgi:hypothetical protein
VQTFTISGTLIGIGGAGATIALTGATIASVTANASGGYSFSVVNGSYTVTATKKRVCLYAAEPSNHCKWSECNCEFQLNSDLYHHWNDWRGLECRVQQ